MASAADDDYYELLGIAPDADDAELRRAWHQLAMRWHPDRAGPDVTFVFQKLSAAYMVLADPTSRAAYDRQRRGAAAEPPEPLRRAPGVLIRRLSAPLNVLLACGIARRAAADVIELFLDAEEVAEGGMVTISMWVPIRCPACASSAACARCGGTRAVDELFAAWLAIRPGVVDGAILKPSAQLPGVIRPVSFRVRVPG